MNTNNVEKFLEFAESLKLVRNEYVETEGKKIIEDIYTDLLPNNGVINKVILPRTTVLIGRKGTGKSTIFQKAHVELDKNKKCMSIYIDVKSLYSPPLVIAKFFPKRVQKLIHEPLMVILKMSAIDRQIQLLYLQLKLIPKLFSPTNHTHYEKDSIVYFAHVGNATYHAPPRLGLPTSRPILIYFNQDNGISY